MRTRLLGFIALLTVAACSSRGCESGQVITVRYRGESVLAPTAQVTRAGEQVGFVDEVTREPGLQRVKLRVRSAAEFTDKDTFEATQDPAGKMGFAVRAGEGKPLFDGAEVDAVPNWDVRERLARMAGAAPGGITLPSGYYVPYPQALTRERVAPEERLTKSLGERLPRSLRLPKGRPRTIDGGTLMRYEAFADSLAGKTPEQISQQFASEGRLLIDELGTQFEAARLAHDSTRMRDVRELRQRLERVERQIQRSEKAQQVMRARSPRQRVLPPELR